MEKYRNPRATEGEYICTCIYIILRCMDIFFSASATFFYECWVSHIKFINSLCRVLENPQSLDIIVIKHEHKMIVSIFVFYTSSCVKYRLKGYYEAAAAILVLPVYQNLPVSAILVQILVNTSIPVSSRIFQYLQY